MSADELSLRSPLPAEFRRREFGSVSLEDITGLPLRHVRGAEAMPLGGAVGEAIRIEEGLVARLTEDEWMLFGESAPGPENRGLVSVTEVTHGYGLLQLEGEGARQVLAKLGGLDYSEAGFPDLRVAQTSLAHVRAVVVRRDQRGRPTYWIGVGRSVAKYMCELLWDAAGELRPEAESA